MTKEKQKQLIAALISEPTKQKACDAVGIDVRTAYNLLRDEGFRTEYNAAVDAVVVGAMNDLRLTITNSITELNTIIVTSNDVHVKLKAIRIAMDCLRYANDFHMERCGSQEEDMNINALIEAVRGVD